MESKSLYTYLKEMASVSGEQYLLGDEVHKLSVSETLSRTEYMASWFMAHGIKAGDYVALQAKRNAPTILALMSLRALGVTIVLTDSRSSCEDFLSESQFPVPVAATVEQGENGYFSVSIADSKYSFYIFDLKPVLYAFEEQSPMEASFIIFTSGSTGNKKAVVLPEQSFISNLLDSAPLGYYTEDDIALGALPLDHVFGLALLTGVFVLGYALYLPANTDIPSLLRTIEKEKITRMNGVPSLYLYMCEQAASYDLTSLRAGYIGGSPIGPERFSYIEKTLGMTLVSVYGMSESIGISCTSYKEPLEIRSNCVGKFYPMNTGAILNPDGIPVDKGQVGEICVKGPMRMLGYIGESLGEEEWLHTGDVGYVDEADYLHVCGRIKDIIIRNGINLSPLKIEEAILSISGVSAACVVGIPDLLQGEVPAAMVVSDVEEAVLFDKLSDIIQKNELPTLIKRVEALPLTASGKPDKICIREELKQ